MGVEDSENWMGSSLFSLGCAGAESKQRVLEQAETPTTKISSEEPFLVLSWDFTGQPLLYPLSEILHGEEKPNEN